uniref:Golgin candidate 6 n=1 Tax=Solanum lycopersicum TaxID=4081 RepID=A0A3Q7IQD1_SOLLC
MDLVAKYQGVVGRVFRNENSGSSEDSYVERLLDRISNGVLAEDRRAAMLELQSVVSESRAGQMAFGAMGFPVILSVLKEERDDFEMVRGALETLVGALSPIGHAKGPANEVQPTLMNSDLLSREVDNISLLLSLLSEEDFYVRYYTLQLLTALLTNSPQRLQEAILSIPRGITRLMDMLMDREVIRNEALLLLTYLTREAEEIQKIVVFESAFEKIFKTINLLIIGGPETDPGRDSNKLTNKTVLVQKKVLDHLFMLGVESQWAPVPVRCAALHCIGDLIANHPKNLEELASKRLGEEPDLEPALNSVLRILLRTSSKQEFMAADYIFKNFCQQNPDGQTMLASTLILQPQSMIHAPVEEDINMSFGSMLLHGLTTGENEGDVETCSRAASVLSHVIKGNNQCKEKVLQIELEAPTPILGRAEPLLHRMVKYLALASSMKSKDGKSSTSENVFVQPIILKLLTIWLSDCPNAVQCFLDSRPHLTYLLELVSNPTTTVCVRGLAAVLLGECVIYNNSNASGKDAYSIVDAISQKVGLTSYFLKFDEMQKSSLFTSAKPFLPRKSLTRSSAVSMSEIEDGATESSDQKNEHPMLASVFDSPFVYFLKRLEADIREKMVEAYSSPNSQVTVVPAELEQRSGENDVDYIKRLKTFVEKQCHEIQNLLSRNATLAEDLARTGGNNSSSLERKVSGGSDRVQLETMRRDLQEASQRIETLKADKAKAESEASTYKNLAGKTESDLKSLSDAYNSLEQANYRLEKEVEALKSGDIEALKEEAREEALKESEAELSDLLVCLGQEQSKVEKLSSRLRELGEDVDTLLEGIGDDAGADDADEDEEEED